MRLPAAGGDSAPGSGRSWECWLVHGEVVGFELAHTAALGRVHQLTVDAYAAQHGGTGVPPIGPAFGLAGLHLALVEGADGLAVRDAHRRMARRRRDWPLFGRIPRPAGLTILDVAEAGARLGSVEGHLGAVRLWAAAVWEAWSPVHAQVARLVEETARPG